MGSMTIGGMAAKAIDYTSAVQAGAPEQYMLRDDPAAWTLLDRLDDLGVVCFKAIVRYRPGDAPDVFITPPEYRREVRSFAARLREPERAQRALADLIAEAVPRSLAGTGAEDRLTFVEAAVVAERGDEVRGITAYVTVINLDEPGFVDRPIELM